MHSFWTEFSSWKDSVPFFPGTLAWLFGLPLWITSLYLLRRRLFEVHTFGICCNGPLGLILTSSQDTLDLLL